MAKNAKKESANGVINVLTSADLRKNVGCTVKTPNGTKFEVLLWQTAKEHGLNTDKSKYGSRLQIRQNGELREFFNSPYNGSGKLTDFYKEVGLETSGSGGEGEKSKTFRCINLHLATTSELLELRDKIHEELKRREEQEAADREAKELLQGLTEAQIKALTARLQKK